MKKNQKNQKGFSLIELLIVVAIIGIIAAIAIPSLIRARAAANEASAIGTLRSTASAEATAMSRNNNIPSRFTALATNGYLDEAFKTNSVRNNYTFVDAAGVNFTNASDWAFSATPQASFLAGTRSFTVNYDFVIRYQDGNTAPQGGTAATGTVLGGT